MSHTLFNILIVFSIVSCTSGGASTGEKLSQPFTATRVVDLTHPLNADTPVWPGGQPFKKTRLVDYEKGYRLHSFSMQENVGTHLDAPAHFFKNGYTVEGLKPDSLISSAIVIDVQQQVKGNLDYQLSHADVKAWEKVHGQVPENSLVILNTGWHKRINSKEDYLNLDENNTMHFPGYSVDAAKLLLERGVVGIGIDTLSLDHGPSTDFATHQEMLGKNKYQLENLANLDQLPATGATVVVGVLPVTGGTQAQARVFAFLE